MLIMAICISPAMARKVKYPNGDVYKGKWKHGAPNGKGDMFYHDGRVYSGFWLDGKRSGQGKYIIPICATDTIFYEGTWSQNRLQEGTLSTQKYTFSGTFKYYSDSIPKPYKGTLLYKNGDKYEGEFAEDRTIKNGKSHISRPSKFEKGVFERGMTEDIEYVDGKEYSGHRCTDSTYYQYQCGDFIEGKFTGVGRDRFQHLGVTTVYYSESEAYRIEFQDTCYYSGDIVFRLKNNGSGNLKSLVILSHKGDLLIDTGGVYKKGTIDEKGRFTGVVRLPSNKEGYSGTIVNDAYRDGVIRMTTDNYVEKGKYVNGVFLGRRTYTGKRTGFQEGEWRNNRLYNGVSKIKDGNKEEDGRYIDGSFEGRIKASKYKIPNGKWVKDFDGLIHGDTITGVMQYYEKDPILDSFSYNYEGSIINGKRHGEAIYNYDCQTLWRNDTLVYCKGMGYGDVYKKWVAEITLKGTVYHVSHYSKDVFQFKNTYDYVPPMELFHLVQIDEKEYQADMEKRESQECQKNIDAERKKNWEYVSTIKVATGYTGPTRGQVSYRYQMVKLYHKKGTSDNILVDYSGEVTNYAVGDKLGGFRRNATYGQPVNWNVLGSPQWGNAFRYYIWGVGYFNL